ncbi:heavy metal-associated isoprenylated plant protein 47-like isoform X1 [Musa acuminata AAA Group]|uniref:heavy metal-associated isoprenylated plant protein 47-like isoform X1 n=1 Tax=Musa acuminata AAA Group TaxID=214697 RepID=UPI0031E2CB81
MKQKIVIKVQIKCDKCRSKAIKLVAATGVDSVAIEGEDKDHLVIVGDDIDPANLTCILRKKVGHANILKVEKAKKHKLESVVHLYPNYPQCSQVVLYDSESCSSNTNACSIL